MGFVRFKQGISLDAPVAAILLAANHGALLLENAP